MKNPLLLFAFVMLLLTSVQAGAEGLLQAARALAGSTLMVDTHIDVPYRLTEEWEDVTRATAKGEFDLPRTRAGGSERR